MNENKYEFWQFDFTDDIHYYWTTCNGLYIDGSRTSTYDLGLTYFNSICESGAIKTKVLKTVIKSMK